MSAVVFTLTAANLGLYFTLLGYFPWFRDMLPGVLAAQLLGPAACALACLVWRKRPKLRFIFAPLPPLALLLASGPQQMLLLAPAILYPEMILFSARFSASYWEYNNHARSAGVVLLLLLLFSQTPNARLLPVIFGTGTLILGAFTLRQLRFGAETGPKQKLLELLSLCSLTAAAWLVARALTGMRQIFLWLTERVFYPIGLLIQRLAAWLSEFTSLARQDQTGSEGPPTPEPTLMMPEQAMEFQELPPADEAVSGAALFRPILVVLGIAACVIAVWLVVFLYRRLRDSRTDEIREDRENLQTEAEEGRGRVPGETERRSNRRKIRRVYEKYLKLLQRRAFVRQSQDSSQEILVKTRSISAEEPAAALRQLYIQARYRPDAVITGAQVREAKRLLRRIKEEN